MADTNDKNTQDPSTQDDGPKYVTHEDLNKALDSRLGRFANNFESKLSSTLETTLSKLSPTPTESGDGKEKPEPDVVRMLKEERKQRQALETRLNQERLHNEITGALRGKVSDTWLDVATTSLKSSAEITKDGQAQLTLDSVPYSVSEGVEQWLRQDSNKRFLPAPAAPTTKKRAPGQAPTASVGPYATASDKESRIQAYLDEQGAPDFFTSDE